MGCWNKTCGLSNLHIYAGTPVYVFVLEDRRDDSNCYSTSLFRPLLLPFQSEYNDYGGGENSSGPAFDYILECIKKELVEMPVGSNKYHDIEVTKEKFGEELFFNAVHENRLAIQGRFSAEPTKIQFTMFRKDIVDDILENRVIEQYVGDSKGTCGYNNNYIHYRFKDIVADIRPMIQEICEMGTKDDFEFKIFSGIEYLFEYNHPNKAAKWLRSDSYRYSRIVDIRSVIAKAFDVGTPDAYNQLEAILTEYLKGMFIDGFMEAARKTWIPGGHEGSQSTSGGALRLLAKATITALDKERADWMIENACDEEEYLE
jgi:hypothetical protein